MSIDGTNLYGKYKDTLIIAMGCDGNNQLTPLEFTITERENIDSRGWFLACIRNKVTQRMRLCVVANRHLGIMVAIIDVHLGGTKPYAYHRICMHHLASNFINQFKDKTLKNLVCRAALATEVGKFNKHMDIIRKINLEAQRWLENIHFEKWVISHDGGRRYWIMTTKMSTVFNSVLKGDRSLPVTALVQLTFFRFNSYFVARREQGCNRLGLDQQYTPYVDAKIKAHVVKARSFEIVLYNHNQRQFHVKLKKGRTHRLNLHDRHKCTCGKTLIYGFPYSHIIAAC